MIKTVLSPASEVREVFISKAGESGEIETIKVILCFRDVMIAFRNQSGEPYAFETKIIENLLYNNEPGLTSDEQKASYVDFRNRHPHLLKKSRRQEFKRALQSDPYFNAFKVKFGYAITCHKAQGSEWKNVFLECNSHFKVLTKDYFRWLYTAITRTSSKLYVVNPPNLSLGGNMKMVGDFDFQPKQGDFNNPQVKDPIPEVSIQLVNTAISNANEPEFQFNDSRPHLLHLFNLVEQSIGSTSIEVLDVIHHQYQEHYVFEKGSEQASVNFIYKGNHRVSAVNSTGESALDTELATLLSHFQGQMLSNDSDTSITDVIFAEAFLAEFHEKVLSVIGNSDIGIGSIEQPAWGQRYSFVRDNETAVVIFWYDGKDRFTKVQAMPQLGNSQSLLRDVLNLWSQV